MKKLFLLLFLTFNLEAQPMNWIMTCKEMPRPYEDIIIWYSADPGATPNAWESAYYSNEKNGFFLTDSRAEIFIPEAQVSHWFIPTPPVSYCGGQEGDGGPLE